MKDYAHFQGDPTRYEIWLIPDPGGWRLELHAAGVPRWVYCRDLRFTDTLDRATPYVFTNRAAARTLAYHLAACAGWGTCIWRKVC